MILRIHLTARRPRPQVGDTKLIKGVPHVRQIRYCLDPMTRKLTQVVRNGRTLFDWVPIPARTP